MRRSWQRRGSTSSDNVSLEAQSKSSLLAFCRLSYPTYQFADHLVRLAGALSAVEGGLVKRLLVTTPPRHGKSELCSVRFPAWYLGRNPDKRIVIASYAADLAERFSRQVRAVITGDRFPAVFPGVQIAQDSRSVATWDIAGRRGGLKAVGVGGPLTGFGANCLVIDDPVKNRAEAQSEVYRNSVWDWYTSTAYTRLEDAGAVVVVMCMVGETPVLMANGREKVLRDVRPGDRIATYDNGHVGVSTVLRWANQGPDAVYEIRMKSGITVKANARHPFLVATDRGTEWQRTATLKKGSIILRAIGASGAASPVQRRDATSLRSAEATATLTTTRRGGRQASDRLQSIRSRAGQHASSIDIASQSRSTTLGAPPRTGSARSADNLPARTFGHIGAASCALTMTMPLERSEDCSATTATSSLATERPQTCYSGPLSTFAITSDVVVDVVPAGREDVFDIQVAGTENFIANGLVSHNTRWHEDDLMGRLLAAEADGTGDTWTKLHLPALDEQGRALWPEKYSEADLTQIRLTIGEYDWSALYMGTPTPREGAFFKVSAIRIVDAMPTALPTVRAWDVAATPGDGDYTAGALMAGPDAEGRFYVADMVRGQWDTDERNRTMRQTADLDGAGVRVLVPQDPGSAGVDASRAFVRLLSGYSVEAVRVTGEKGLRADPFSSQVNAGNVCMVRGAWNRATLDEMRSFPLGRNDDQVDALADAFNALTRRRIVRAY